VMSEVRTVQSSDHMALSNDVSSSLHTRLLESFPSTGLISTCIFTVLRQKCQSCIMTRANSSDTGPVCMNDWI
jgi:hypothetical protein